MKGHLACHLIILFLLSVSCSEDFKNKPHYKLSVGEEVEIYYSTNSCCRYCQLAESSNFHVTLLDDTKIIKDYPQNCDGCSRTSAFVFKALTAGIDTIYIQNIEMSQDCDSGKPENAERYILEVVAKE